MIKVKEINDINHIEEILNNLKPVENYINTLSEDCFEYEDLCEKVVEQFCEIDEFLFGKKFINKNELFLVDLRMMIYWDYLQNKISFKRLIKKLNKYN